MCNTIDIMNRGMECLTDSLGVVEAERFISFIIKEKFDYTKWQRQYFDAMPSGEFHEKALEYAVDHPYTGKAPQLQAFGCHSVDFRAYFCVLYDT